MRLDCKNQLAGAFLFLPGETSSVDFRIVEEKWQKRWADARLFEADPDPGRRKFFLTAAFPYPNSPQHIGHARTYTTADVYARYLRMNGFNVLFPMAFHVTGTPVLAMAKRVAKKDAELLEVFKNVFGIPDEIISTFTEPQRLVEYFSREIELGMREMGFSIDWRRKFYSNEPIFNAFVRWQFEKLKEMGYLIQGSHPVPWCPQEDNAVGAHDTKGDIDPELGQVVLIKFELMDEPGTYLLCATFRPETIYGVTNVWVNPEEKYSLIDISGVRCYVSSSVARTLALQIQLRVMREIQGEQLLGGKVRNLVTGELVPILPASFVDPRVGSGIVMSVPAHAPYDYLALRDLRGTKWEKDILPPKQVLKLEGYGEFPAKELVEQMGVKDQNDPRAEEATHKLYKAEAHTGRMIVGKYTGMKGVEAKERVRADIVEGGQGLLVHEVINGPIWCRCGAQVCVKIVSDQWFINYGDAGWKELAKQALAGMRLIPEKSRAEYEYTIDWLRAKACVRAQGLGTRFPYDETKVIESLSDSTIYMAFYTIAHKLRKVDVSKLNLAFFDYVFLGKGEPPSKEAEEMRREFLYWYPHDSRHSGADLIHNHLTFFIFNHAAIFPRELWPRQIVTNGFVLREGTKMSKSLGNILPLRDAVRKYGADVVRFSVVSGAELSADSNFNETMVEGVRSRILWMGSLLDRKFSAPRKGIDDWLLSRLHGRIKSATKDFDVLALREITQEIFYNAINDLRWYLKRTEGNAETMREFLKSWCRLIAPFMPHVAEELWEKMGEKGFVSMSDWPRYDEKKINERVELAEEVVVQTREDIESILKLIGKKPSGICLLTADPWKRDLYSVVHETKSLDAAMKRAMAKPELRTRAKDAQRVVQKLMKNVGALRPVVLTQDEETAALADAADFFAREFGAEVRVIREGEARGGELRKALDAMPMRPSIYLEFTP